ncbi:hypothetical protein [Piscinibacter terrae]|jgi:hypothetical protein|uniref:Lipoprotein n=1 Tax=Piscinibacter terrae TaxID=2496871 RepID=A0A3N7K259_9BURK|nr:hypothetical protein [Albitalea terrae]RQP25025.1 hypothetical protein DZC73_09215 [Albitalea terrae]
MSSRTAWLTLAAALLCGCAQINWDRAVYEGMRESARQSANRPGAQATPDPKLPDYDKYEEERRRVRKAE